MEILYFHLFRRTWHFSSREGDRQTNCHPLRRVTKMSPFCKPMKMQDFHVKLHKIYINNTKYRSSSTVCHSICFHDKIMIYIENKYWLIFVFPVYMADTNVQKHLEWLKQSTKLTKIVRPVFKGLEFDVSWKFRRSL